MSVEVNKALVRRYYEELWNRWDLKLADELIAPNVAFRGSLGTATSGIEGFRQYVGSVRAAFPDFQNTIEELIAEGDRVVARLTYRGTHQGDLFGIPPTGKQVTYAGLALFRIAEGKIVDIYVVGDTLSLMQQLSISPFTGRVGS